MSQEAQIEGSQGLLHPDASYSIVVFGCIWPWLQFLWTPKCAKRFCPRPDRCFMLRVLLEFAVLWHLSVARRNDVFPYLNCDGHKSWSDFREALLERRFKSADGSGLLDFSGPDTRQSLAELGALADTLLVEHFASLDIGNFVAVLAEPGLTQSRRRAQDCVYGVVAALYIRGQELLAQGEAEAAAADWEMALQFLGKELGLDFMESTDWPRSANILLSLAKLQGSPVAKATAPIQRAAGGHLPKKGRSPNIPPNTLLPKKETPKQGTPLFSETPRSRPAGSRPLEMLGGGKELPLVGAVVDEASGAEARSGCLWLSPGAD